MGVALSKWTKSMPACVVTSTNQGLPAIGPVGVPAAGELDVAGVLELQAETSRATGKAAACHHLVDRSFEQILDGIAGRSLMCGLLLSGQLAMAGGQVGLALLLVLRCEGEMGRTVVWLLLENELEEAQAVGRVTVLEQ